MPFKRRVLVPKFEKPLDRHCHTCPYLGFSTGYVPGYGVPTARILLVGESPAFDEQVHGEPFVGAAGSMLTRVLKIINRHREQYLIDNVVRCTLEDPSLERHPGAVNHCKYVDETIALRQPEVVVPMGAIPLKRVLGLDFKTKGIRVQDFHGTVQRDPTDSFWVVPTYHPSHLQRGATNLMGVMAFDLRVAQGIVEDGWAPDPGELYLDPPVEWFKAWAENYLAAVLQDPYGFPLAVDIETPDKAPDEGEILARGEAHQSKITRYNFSCNPDEGITVPDEEPYRSIVKRVVEARGVKYLWHKGFDVTQLRAAGMAIDTHRCWDGMWAWKVLQSDVPMGLGFAAPFFSRFGAWKHLAKVEPVRYAAIDGLQTRRTVDGIIADLIREGRFDVFERHLHRFHATTLQPATNIGLAIDRTRLTEFKAKLDKEAGTLLDNIADLVPEALCPLTPKQGLTKPPLSGELHAKARNTKKDGTPKKEELDPLKMALYARAHVVERLAIQSVGVCKACGRIEVAKTHRCADKTLTPNVVKETATVRRWYWQEPFNPDSPVQLMAYVLEKGHKPGKSKATGKDAVDRDTLIRLWGQTGDRLYALVMDYRAVGKVRGTYVVGTEKRLDADDRIHGTVTFKPSTMRTSMVNPNLQNVVADKDESRSLAAGFRHCVVARGRWVEEGSEYADGLPS